MSMNDLVAVSRRYGADPDYVVAGGGNTSWKTEAELFIKGSGSALESIDENGFVRMDRAKLAAIWTKAYPDDTEARENAVLVDLMAARLPGEESKRPSVETLLHDILPHAFVVHTHPALVNGITCSAQGEQAAWRLFGDEALWIPSTNPGYVLSRDVRKAFAAHRIRTGSEPVFILLQNHGIFVAADSVAGIDAIYSRVMIAIADQIKRKPDFSDALGSFGRSEKVVALIGTLCASRDSPLIDTAVGATGSTARFSGVMARSTASTATASSATVNSAGSPASVFFRRDAELARLTASAEAFAPVASAYTPDHIVYAGSDPLFVETFEDIEAAWIRFIAEKKRNPKIVALKGTGIFGIGTNAKSARLAVELFMDAAKVAAYAEAFGGPSFMSQDQIDFINNWEVERYRSKISTSAG